MARAVTIGNGNVLVGLDQYGQVRDLYYPQVGYANHVSGASGSYVHRLGMYVDGQLSWLSDPGWEITTGCDGDTLTGSMFATNAQLGVSLASRDVVHNEHDVFLRRFTISNERDQTREVKLFMAQQFRINESRRGDTGLYDPRVGAIIHYKGQHTFLVNAFHGETQFSDYNIGLFGIEGKEGTYHDAADGMLERNPIEHGSVDSVIGLSCNLVSCASTEFTYWIACGESVTAVHELDALVLEEGVDRLCDSTEAYWQAWIKKEGVDVSSLSHPLQQLYRRSLLIMRVHTDNRGGIIASSDTDMLHHGRDTYGYVWPRDAALIAHAFDRTGYVDTAQRFYKFMTGCVEPQGYLMHKYRVDGALGSSWHPWMHGNVPRLPIQEDETAGVVAMLWEHYELHRDLEFIESLYNPFIEPAAEFMVEYIDAATGLPQASYDLWEEKYGISTYTASVTYAGLMAASRFAMMLGKEDSARTYQAVAERMQRAILTHLYDKDLGMFVKHVNYSDDGEADYDRTVDSSSFFGVIQYGVLDVDDERVARAFAVMHERLWVDAESEGYVRYEGDNYYTMQEAGTPNPWVICTLWVAQYYIKKAKTEADLAQAYQLLEWTCSHATSAGVLAEQMHPHTREHLSTAPLVWSHAEFVITVNDYLKKVAELAKTD